MSAARPDSEPVHATARELCAWVARFGAATAADLAVRFDLPERRVCASLGKLVKRGLVRRTGALAGEREIFVATAAGLRAVGMRELGVCRASARAEGHLRAVSAAAVWLERGYGQRFEVWGERELRARQRLRNPGRVRPLASPYVHHRAGGYKRPDLLLVPRSPADGLPVAVEVELTRKTASRLEAVMRAWLGCADVSGVVYLAAPAVMEPVRMAIGRAGAHHRVAVLALADCDVPALRRKPLYRPARLPRDLGIGAGSTAVAASDARGGQVHPDTFETAATRAHARVRVPADASLDDVVRWVGRFGLVPAETIALHLDVGERELRRLLLAGVRGRLLRATPLLRGDGVGVWATSRGLSVAGLGHLPTCTVNYHAARSMGAHARIAVALERERPGCLVMARRELLAGLQAPAGTLLSGVARALPGLGTPECAALGLAVVPFDGGHATPALVALDLASRAKLRTLLGRWCGWRGAGQALLYVPGARLARARRDVAALGCRLADVDVRALPCARAGLLAQRRTGGSPGGAV